MLGTLTVQIEHNSLESASSGIMSWEMWRMFGLLRRCSMKWSAQKYLDFSLQIHSNSALEWQEATEQDISIIVKMDQPGIEPGAF